MANLSTSDMDRLVMAWPWLLEAVTKESSSLFESFGTCNSKVFPVQSTLLRIGTGIGKNSFEAGGIEVDYCCSLKFRGKSTHKV